MRGRNNRFVTGSDLSSRRNPANRISARFVRTSRYFPSLLGERERERVLSLSRMLSCIQITCPRWFPAAPRHGNLSPGDVFAKRLSAARRRDCRGPEIPGKRDRERKRKRISGPRNRRNCVRRKSSARGLRCQRLRRRVQLSEDVGRRCRLIPGTWPTNFNDETSDRKLPIILLRFSGRILDLFGEIIGKPALPPRRRRRCRGRPASYNNLLANRKTLLRLKLG